MANMIKYREYRRKVFNKALLECFSRIHESCCGIDKYSEHSLSEMAKKMSDAFYTEHLCLNSCTISETKEKLSEAVTFIQDCLNISEAIAEDKMEIAQKAEVDPEPESEVELSAEDEELIDKVFEEKGPEMQVDQVRDATVKALIAEDKKAQEIRDSLDIAQSQVQAGGDPKVMEETVARLNGRGPTSLMNAIMNQMSAFAVQNVNENSKTPVAVGKIMAENAEKIRDRATMAYMLYEASSVFGIIPWTEKTIKEEAHNIYYNK